VIQLGQRSIRKIEQAHRVSDAPFYGASLPEGNDSLQTGTSIVRSKKFADPGASGDQVAKVQQNQRRRITEFCPYDPKILPACGITGLPPFQHTQEQAW
jgi:hypothetical protein